MTMIEKILQAVEDGKHLHPGYWKKFRTSMIEEERYFIEALAQRAYSDGFNDEIFDQNYGKFLFLTLGQDENQ
jgi:hypothetical protein